MAFSFIASALGANATTATVLACSSALNVAAGDLLVCWIAYQDPTTETVGVAGATNSFTMEATTKYSGSMAGAFGYVLMAAADAAETFTMTLSAARRRRTIVVIQFRPDSGETVTKDVANTGTGTSNAPQSGNITTTGDDEVVCGGASADDPQAAYQIGDAAAGGSIDSTYGSAWYKLYTATQANIHAQCVSNTDDWVCNIISFKSVAAGGSILPLVAFGTLGGNCNPMMG